MKRNILFIAVIFGCLIAASVSWGFTWYVNPVSGDDDEDNPSYNDPLRTISEAIDRAASSGDIIRLFSGDFAHEGFKEMIWNYQKLRLFIDVVKSLTIERVSSSFHPRIVGFYNTMSDADSLINSNIMRLRDDNISIKYITFDGYNYYYHYGYGGYFNPDSLYVSMPHCSTIFISCFAPNARIEGCTFMHMGRSLETEEDTPDTLRHESIIGAHPTGSSPISGIEIVDNLFYNNPIDSQHGHEVYFTSCYDTEISGNTIYSNGVGVPLRFSTLCNNIEIDDNYVCGAAQHGFITDYDPTGTGDYWSYNIKVTNNVFSDTTYAVIDGVNAPSSMYPDYHGPFISHLDGFNLRSAFISEFQNNIVAEKDSVIFPNDHTTADKIYGVVSDADEVYISIHRTEEDCTRVYAFDEKNGPILRPLLQTPDDEKPTNEICRTDDHIIVNTVSGSNNSLYKFRKDGTLTNEFWTAWAKSFREITALGLYNGDQFFAATIESGTTPKIFKGDISDSTFVEIYDASSINAVEITAMTYSGSKVVFAVKKADNNTYIYSMDTDGTDDTNEHTFSTSDVPAMTYFNNYLYTVRENNGSGITTLYQGSYSSPEGSSLSLSTTEVSSIGGWRTSSDYIFTIKNVSSDGDKKLYFTDAPMTNLFQDILYYSRWWKSF
ncbi:MAG: hypothetical protein JXB48_24780 [Candidatus Latescibacteria bacterium]|nr:hypothetical protein [Candidatus Latescibacterota bacterium]